MFGAETLSFLKDPGHRLHPEADPGGGGGWGGGWGGCNPPFQTRNE